MENQPIEAPPPPIKFQPGIFSEDPPDIHPTQPNSNTVKRKVFSIQMQIMAQGDTGANTSATNRRDILWHYQPLSIPIPIQTYEDPTSADNSQCTAIGQGQIRIVSNDNTIMEWQTLYVPTATGTVLSPDRYMMDNRDVSTFNHSGDRKGHGNIRFYTTTAHLTDELSMRRTKDGLWFTTNAILVPPSPDTPTVRPVQATTPETTHRDHEPAVSPTTNRQDANKNPSKKSTTSVKNPTEAQLQNFELWHQRMAHPSGHILIQTQNTTTGIPKLPEITTFFSCPFCDQAKMKKRSPKKLEPKDNILPGMKYHMDIGFIRGPANLEEVLKNGATPNRTLIESREGFTCYLLIIDAASRYIWVFPLLTKQPPTQIIDQFLTQYGGNEPSPTITTSSDGILARSSKFQQTVHQHGFKRRIIRTDNGGELAGSMAFRKTVASHGYVLETTAPDASSQNGIAERPHRTLKEKVRCLLYTAGLGTPFWADALRHATWLYNRTYHTAIKRTPFEAFTGRRPACDSIITFGARITPKKAKNRSNALDPNTYQGIFLGYTATTDNIRYWDVNAQQERRATHIATDEIQYGDEPTQRSPASQHLLKEMVKPTIHVPQTATLLDNDKSHPTWITVTTPTTTTTPPAWKTIAKEQLLNTDEPQPTIATAAKVQVKHSRYADHSTLAKELQQLHISLNPWETMVTEHIPLKGVHPLLGMILTPHPDFDDTIQLDRCEPGSTIARNTRRYRSRLHGQILHSIDDTPIPTVAVAKTTNAQLRSQGRTHVDLHFVQPMGTSQDGEGIPLLQFDQLNVITHHLRSIQKKLRRRPQSTRTPKHKVHTFEPSNTDPTTDPDPPSEDERDEDQWKDPTTWPPIQPDDILYTVFKGLAAPKLTRRRLMQSPTWQQFLHSEWTQLDKYDKQDMFGTPCPKDSIGDAVVLPWVWTYLWKLDPKTFEEKAKARGTCNGGKRYGKVITLADTYAACVEQPAHRITWAIVAALNAFAEADGPDKPLYMQVDDQFQEWWTQHLGHPPIPHGHVIPIKKNLQGHPEAPRLWHRHIHAILRNDLGFESTTHETCLYHKRDEQGKLILILRQVDDFLIAAPDLATCQQIRQQIQSHMANELYDLGVIKRFNGVDIQQSRNFVKVHCQTYIDRILEHHGWSEEKTATLPVPMRSESTYQADIQLSKGPSVDTPEAQQLETTMGFSYRQALGELIFAMSICRLDISPAVIQPSQHAAHPAKIHYQALKAIFLYLNTTKSEGLYYWRPQPRMDLPDDPKPIPVTALDRLAQYYQMNQPTILHGATDSTWASDRAHRRSMGGVVFLLAGGAVYYRSRLQPDTAQSSTEAELYSMTDAGKAALYLRSLLHDLGIEQELATVILADNHGATQLTNAQQPTKRTRHVDMKHFVILEWTEEEKIHFRNTETQFNYSDSLSKPNARIKHHEHNDIMMGRRQPAYVRHLHAFLYDLSSTFRLHTQQDP